MQQGSMVAYNDNNDDDLNRQNSNDPNLDDENESLPDEQAKPSRHNATSRTKEQATEVRNLAARETRYVWYWKFGVVLAIVMTATVVCVGTYLILQNKEYEDYLDSVSFTSLIAYRVSMLMVVDRFIRSLTKLFVFKRTLL
jgi:cytochrome c-type biogenesis protein CcmH/NrfG